MFPEKIRTLDGPLFEIPAQMCTLKDAWLVLSALAAPTFDGSIAWRAFPYGWNIHP